MDTDPRDFAHDPEAPWPVRRGGWILRLYEHSLGLAFILLFLLSWIGHALGGFSDYAAEEVLHHQPEPTFTDYVTSSRFWFESFQNWQSEFLAIAAMVWLAVYLRHVGRRNLNRYTHRMPKRDADGIVLGLGLGGFVDGITLHQIMQWHNMGSAVLPPTTMDAMAQHMVWDGMFHAATLVLTLVGVLMLWSDGVAGLSPRRLSVLIGQMLLGPKNATRRRATTPRISKSEKATWPMASNITRSSASVMKFSR